MARTQLLGSVDLLGLNAYGENPGLSPIVGALIGGGASGVTTILSRHVGPPALANNSELTGLGVGLLVAGGMYASKRTRHAALGAAVGAVLASGLAFLEKMLMGTVVVPAATAAAATAIVAANPGVKGAMGMANIRALGGLGISQMQQLGIANMQRVAQAQGTAPGAGVAGLRAHAPGTMPTNLMGPSSAAGRQIALMGGPAIHGIASHWGSTVTGGGRG